MTRVAGLSSWILLVVSITASAQTPPALTIVNAGPRSEIASLDEANEIRIVFSEPMVALGRIPSQPEVPFVRISPAIPGSFRWSGTTILIFTPDPKQPLPYATTYTVTVDASATAVSGRTLAKPETFTFTTPTVKLLQTNWYRRGGTVDGRIVLVLRFNQPVERNSIASALSAALQPHPWTPPSFSPEAEARLKALDPAALGRFNAKVEATRAVARSSARVALRLTNDWDRERFPASPDLVAFEMVDAVSPESHVLLTLAATVRSPAGQATPGKPQQYTIDAEPAFFVTGFWCTTQCDADRRNPIRTRTMIRASDFAAAVGVTHLAPGAERRVVKPAQTRRDDDDLDYGGGFTLEDAGYDPQPPASRYAVTLSPDLKSADGQTLGYTWLGIADNWHMRAFTSFGDGEGVWEKDGGAQLPFYARNMVDVTQWAQPVAAGDLMPLLVELRKQNFRQSPSGAGVMRKIGGTPDRILSHGLDLSKALRPSGSGIVWASVREGDPIPESRRIGDDTERERTKSSVVQVTNLGLTVKDSPQNTLIFVTRLDNGAPVPNANVSIVRTDNSTFWSGTTDGNGVVIAPNTRLRQPNTWYQFAFIVTAEKDGDIAYVGSDWNEGISPWEFGTGLNLNQRDPMLRGTVFTDRGVYRLGEEVHLKAVLRHNTPTGVRLLPASTSVFITIRDSQNRVVDERTIRVNDWSSAEWTMTLPAEGTLGNYSLRAILESDRPKPPTPEERRRDVTPSPEDDMYVDWEKSVHGSFLVAAYRRPDFRVDVTLTGGAAIAGDPLSGTINARYLYGAPMGARPLAWRFAKSPGYGAPAAITERFGSDRWVFVGSTGEEEPLERGNIRSEETTLGKDGQTALTLETKRDAGVPYIYTLEGDVEDASRQHIANRSTVVVHPAPFYVGVRRPSYFLQQKAGLQTEIAAVGLDGTAVSGVPVDVTLTQVQWTSVRRAEGNGFYTWDTERKLVPAGQWTVTTSAEPVPLDIDFNNGGYFTLEARGRGEDGRFAVTRTSFYVLGSGYTAWQRFDHNRIELTPERQTYRPGETARIMIQSPWEQATALVTMEREGIRSHRQFALTSTQQSIEVPITEGDIPNVFVSVVLVKGRTVAPVVASDVAAKPEADSSDPGKPAFRMGYVELNVEDRSKRLTVAVTANREEYRPASPATVTLDVKDHQGHGTASEVTLWAVDYGVLSLTSYRTPDILGSVYVHKALQVLNADSRQRIVSRRVLTPKGSTEGGGGGIAGGAGMLRKDFRVLAFWVGSVTTDANGRATVDVKLPESLTTYRIMAVAGDRSSRFGSGDTEVRTNKPLTLAPTFPRFMAVGDRAFFGAVVGSQLKAGGPAVVTMKSLDPSVLELTGPTEQRLNVEPGASVEVRFAGAAKAIGRARVQMTVTIGSEKDAFEDVIPVEVLASPETVAAYGEASGETTRATETLTVPGSIVPGFGGLHVEVASTALVGLGEGARYLVEYPYGCAEQKGSRAIALLLAADLGDAFSLPGMDPSKMRPEVQSTLKELERFQCPSGGFSYWPGACTSTSPYLTAYLLHVFKVASDMKYEVSARMREQAYSYLERELAAKPPANEGWWPAYTAWQSFAVKVLVEGGRNQDSNLTRLYGYRERMPVFAIAYLHDAMMARGERTGSRVDELRRRMRNAILPEAGASHVEELSDPYLLWFWNSNIRSTAIVLDSLVKADALDMAAARPMVRWLMNVREDGRWGNTQENAHAMQALVNYYRRFEPDAPNFRAVVALGGEELATAEFRQRSAESEVATIPMSRVVASGAAGAERPLTFTREGTGTLYYTTRLRYAVDTLFQEGLDSGFHVERKYEPFVENGARPVSTTYAAGDLVRVTLTFRLSKERRFVAVTDPLPAGFEAVESWFSTTASDLRAQQDRQRNERDVEEGSDWQNWFRSGGFDHVERHDNRIQLFATRLSEGVHEFSYIARATTAGTFRTAPARAEEMYTPEVFGRTGTTVVEVKR
jgi:uncharacterized protein YfaS (alpha-2-macroglobulin family)